VGDAVGTAARLAELDGVRPVVLCGRNERLRRTLATAGRCLALGWRDDLPDLFAAAAVLVDNAGGETCAEAFAAGLPVVSYRPLPGHGRLGVRALGDAALVTPAGDGATLLDAVEKLRRPGSVRDEQRERAAAVFVEDPAVALRRWLADRAATAGPG
jgi:UDP-N-acetylglucosamine:LPS N-acetylglucosamine transferase